MTGIFDDMIDAIRANVGLSLKVSSWSQTYDAIKFSESSSEVFRGRIQLVCQPASAHLGTSIKVDADDGKVRRLDDAEFVLDCWDIRKYQQVQLDDQNATVSESVGFLEYRPGITEAGLAGLPSEAIKDGARDKAL